MQAIVTKYLGPTDHRGSRVVAKCQAGKLTLGWDDALDSDDNHRAAAMALVKRLGWDAPCYGTWVRGSLPDGCGDVFVCVPKAVRHG